MSLRALQTELRQKQQQSLKRNCNLCRSSFGSPLSACACSNGSGYSSQSSTHASATEYTNHVMQLVMDHVRQSLKPSETLTASNRIVAATISTSPTASDENAECCCIDQRHLRQSRRREPRTDTHNDVYKRTHVCFGVNNETSCHCRETGM